MFISLKILRPNTCTGEMWVYWPVRVNNYWSPLLTNNVNVRATYNWHVCIHNLVSGVSFLKAHIPSRTSSAQKNAEFRSVRCDSLGVRQNSFMIWRERQMNVIHLLCASTSAHIFCMFKNVRFFPRVNIDARRTSDQRQSNARHK